MQRGQKFKIEWKTIIMMQSTLIKVKLLIKMGSCEKPGNFNPHQSKEIDKIAHQAYNNVDFKVKKKNL